MRCLWSVFGVLLTGMTNVDDLASVTAALASLSSPESVTELLAVVRALEEGARHRVTIAARSADDERLMGWWGGNVDDKNTRGDAGASRTGRPLSRPPKLSDSHGVHSGHVSSRRSRIESVVASSSILQGRLAKAALTASSVSAKVKALDTCHDRLSTCLRRVEDVVGVKSCLDGAKKAVDCGDWQSAVAHLHTFDQIDPVIVSEQSKVAAEIAVIRNVVLEALRREGRESGDAAVLDPSDPRHMQQVGIVKDGGCAVFLVVVHGCSFWLLCFNCSVDEL